MAERWGSGYEFLKILRVSVFVGRAPEGATMPVKVSPQLCSGPSRSATGASIRHSVPSAASRENSSSNRSTCRFSCCSLRTLATSYRKSGSSRPCGRARLSATKCVSKAISELRKAVGDDPKAPRFIQTIPKGGYRLVPPVTYDECLPGTRDAPVALQPSPRAATRFVGSLWWLTAGALLLVAFVSGGTWFKSAQQRPSPVSVAGPPERVVPLTTMIGYASHPTFSPDGEQVAFDWNGQKQDNWDIYVTLVGSSDMRRLTSDPLPDENPAWSPDGRQIAFLRKRPDGTTIQLVSALGGADQKLGDFRGADSLSWSPDGHWVAAGRPENVVGQPGGIYLISPNAGDSRPLVVATAGSVVSQPAFSPDGHRLAYMSS